MDTRGYALWPEVHALTGLSRVTIWREEKESRFPSRRLITRKRVGWLREEVEQWIATRGAADVRKVKHN